MTYAAVAFAGGGYADPEALSATAGTWPAIAVEVAFTTTPASLSPAWVDVTADARDITISRGRQRELDRFAAGRASVTLNNRLRKYDPSYVSSPYNGYIIPMRRIRIRATYAGVTYPLFDGYVDSWDQEYHPPRDAIAVVHATDGFKVLSKAQLPNSVWANELRTSTAAHWWRLGEASGTVAYDLGSTPINGTYYGSPTLGAASLILNDTDPGVTFDKVNDYVRIDGAAPAPPYSIGVWVQTTNTGGNFLQIQNDPSGRSCGFDYTTAGFVEYVDISSGSGPYVAYATAPIADGLPHHLLVTMDASNAHLSKLYIDGVLQATASIPPTGAGSMSGGGTVWIGQAGNGLNFYGGELDEVTIYTTELTATDAARLYSAGRTPWTGDLPGARIGHVLDAINWSSTQREIDTGSSTLISATLSNTFALDHIQSAVDSDFGDFFMTAEGLARFIGRAGLVNQPSNATFGDTAGETWGDVAGQIWDTLDAWSLP